MLFLEVGKLYKATAICRGVALSGVHQRWVLGRDRVIMGLGDNQALTHHGVMCFVRTDIEYLELVRANK